MKIRVHYLLLLIIISFSWNVVFAQSGIEKKINLSADQKLLTDVLYDISELSGFEFAYSSNLIPSNAIISCDFKETPVSQILDYIFKDLNINWIILNGQIVLKSKSAEDNSKTNTFTISGVVRDNETGETLIGVNIYNKQLSKGTITNEYGFYSFTLPEGNYEIEFSYTGYNKISKQIQLNDILKTDISLHINESLLEEVVVTPDEIKAELHLINPSRIDFKPHAINKIPNVLGEPDVVKAIQLTPGVTSLYEGASTFYVRGGNRDQNLILVDDAPVYNPSHLFGLFSAFDQSALKEISILKSGINAKYGGRLSSVLDVRMNDGNKERFSVTGGVGLISARLSVNGPIVKGKSSFMLSGRRSIFGYLLKGLTGTNLSNIYFYDLSGKINLQLNRNNHLYFSFYTGRDSYEDENANQSFNGINWLNALTTIRWNHIYNSRWFSNVTLLYSTYQYYLGSPQSNSLAWYSQIKNVSLLTDVSYFINPKNTLRFGYKLTSHNFNPGQLNTEYSGNVPEREAIEQAIYISNDQKVNEQIYLNYGLRIPIFQNVGISMVYSYDQDHKVIDSVDYTNYNQVYNTYAFFEPRFTIKYLFGSDHVISLSYEKHHQFLQLLTNLTGSLTSVEVWLPSDKTIKPQVADQLTLGYFKSIFQGRIKFSSEVYYKYMQNQIDYKDHAQLLLNPYIEGELRFGDGWAYGFEVSLSKETGRQTGMVSYSYSRAERQITGINNSNIYSAIYDRPHELSLYFSSIISPRWILSANWIYASGSPLTTPSSFYYYQGNYVPVYHERNNERFPDYHRLDFSATFRTDPSRNKKFSHNLTFAIYNLYGRQNPISINFNKIENDDGSLVVSNDVLNTMDQIVTQMYIYSFMPSISYNFKF